MQSSFCLYLMHHENGNAGLNKRETGIEAFSPVARVFQRLARGNLATGRGRSVRFTGYYVSLLPKVGEPPQAAVLPPTFET